MYRFLISVLLYVSPVFADYDCVCNYNVEAGIYQQANTDGQPMAYLYEFDCKPKFGDKTGNFYGIMYEKQVGYIEINAQVQLQTCPGEIPLEDKLTTVTILTTTPVPTTEMPTTQTTTTEATTVTTTPSPTTIMTTTTTQATTMTTTPIPTTTMSTTTTQATTMSTTPIPTSTMSSTTTSTTLPTTTTTQTTITTAASTSIDGNLDLCHGYIKNDANKNHGFLGQHGQYCYELVDTPTQWAVAERHCRLLLNGSLVHILSQTEQDYIVKFLTGHTYIKSVWIGLTDTDVPSIAVSNSTEGNWKWSSGAPYTYNNFGNEFTSHTDQQHKLNDCVVMHQGGEWSDLPCGINLGIVGFGESHPYICQINISNSLPNVISVINEVVG